MHLKIFQSPGSESGLRIRKKVHLHTYLGQGIWNVYKKFQIKIYLYCTIFFISGTTFVGDRR